jgi:hypothetical protein
MGVNFRVATVAEVEGRETKVRGRRGKQQQLDV